VKIASVSYRLVAAGLGIGFVAAGAPSERRVSAAPVPNAHRVFAESSASVHGKKPLFSCTEGTGSFVGGGVANYACDPDSGVGDGEYNVILSPTDSGSAEFIGGGYDNVTTSGNAFIGGGEFNAARGPISGVGAGDGNTTYGNSSFVAGGYSNTASGDYSFIGGGYDVNTGIGANVAFIGAGFLNYVSGNGSFVGAGGWNGAKAKQVNAASGTDSFIGAGDNNNVAGTEAFIGGGQSNSIAAAATYGVIAGGDANTAGSLYSVVDGGEHNTAKGVSSVVGGGADNTAQSTYATIPGGYDNAADGVGSFAAGSNAKARNTGSFVWNDNSNNTALQSTANYQFKARASGGYVLYSNSAATIGAQLAPNSGTWGSVSDRRLKSNVTPLDDAAVLEKVAALPVSEWSYTAEHGVRHVGPMAQDFYAAFGVGEDDRHITSIDEDGVALAAIKALHAENADLRSRLAREQAVRARDEARWSELRNEFARDQAQRARDGARLAALEARDESPTRHGSTR